MGRNIFFNENVHVSEVQTTYFGFGRESFFDRSSVYTSVYTLRGYTLRISALHSQISIKTVAYEQWLYFRFLPARLICLFYLFSRTNRLTHGFTLCLEFSSILSVLPVYWILTLVHTAAVCPSVRKCHSFLHGMPQVVRRGWGILLFPSAILAWVGCPSLRWNLLRFVSSHSMLVFGSGTSTPGTDCQLSIIGCAQLSK